MKYEKGSFIILPNKNILTGQPSGVQSVFLWICNFADDQGVCFPSRKKLAQSAGVSLNTLDRSFKKLIELGILKVTPRFTENEQTTNEYQIMFGEGGIRKIDITPTQNEGTELNPLNSTKNMPASSKTGGKTLKAEKVQTFNFQQIINNLSQKETLSESEKRMLWFIKLTNMTCRTKKEWDKERGRLMASAAQLTGYTQKELEIVVKYLEDKNLEYTFETIAKKAKEIIK